jgi:1,2-phenylacetyl-CoA epoxidase PaaB subunit
MRLILSGFEWSQTMNKLNSFNVFLHEDKGDKFQIVYQCLADDEDHAEQKALFAYPNAEIVHISTDSE